MTMPMQTHKLTYISHVACITGCLFVVGCGRSSSSTEQFLKSAELVDTYLNTNAPGAEAAMLELEKLIHEWESRGATGIDYDQQYAAVYSRLILVTSALGKNQEAKTYYNRASNYWRKVYEKKGLPLPSTDQMLEQINAVDRHLTGVRWKSQN